MLEAVQMAKACFGRPAFAPCWLGHLLCCCRDCDRILRWRQIPVPEAFGVN